MRIRTTRLAAAAAGAIAFMASARAQAANDGIPATLSAVFDGTYETVFYGDSDGGLSYTYYDTVTHVGWTGPRLLGYNTNCGNWPSCEGFLVGSPMTSWYNPNGSGDHVAFLWNIPGTSHGQLWANLEEVAGTPDNGFGGDGNYDPSCSCHETLNGSGAIPASGVNEGTINGHNTLIAANPTSLANVFHSNTGQNSQNIAYLGTDNRLHSQYNNGGGWADSTFPGNLPYGNTEGRNLTAMYDGAISHIFYYGYSSSYVYNVYELYYSNGWYQGWPPALSSGWLSSSTGVLEYSEYLFGASSTGMQLDKNIGGWSSQNDTSTGCNSASPSLTYVISTGHSYNFCSAGGSVYMVIDGGSNGTFDMSLPVAAETSNSFPGSSPLAGFEDSTGTCHVFYIGTDSAIHELYSSTCAYSASWSGNRITSTGAVAN